MVGFCTGRIKAIGMAFSVIAVVVVLLLTTLTFPAGSQHLDDQPRVWKRSAIDGNHFLFIPSSNRKLLQKGAVAGTTGGGGEKLVEVEQPKRIGEGCSEEDVVVYQGPTAPLPNGIPTYTVQILNVCVSGCAVSRIHLSCGWFSSARLINPRLFRRLRYDDCLVNDGRPLPSGGVVSFQYANSFHYPLAVSSLSCVPST